MVLLDKGEHPRCSAPVPVDRYVVAVVEEGRRWFEPASGYFEGDEGAESAASVAKAYNSLAGRRAAVIGVP